MLTVLAPDHSRAEKDLEHEAFLGLIQPSELALFDSKVTRNVTDGKIDKFPSRNRFAATLQLIMADAASMYRTGLLRPEMFAELLAKIRRVSK